MEWISVKDKLPNPEEHLNKPLLGLKHGEMVDVYVTFLKNGTSYFWTEPGREDKDITHWMPIPQPPNDP